MKTLKTFSIFVAVMAIMFAGCEKNESNNSAIPVTDYELLNLKLDSLNNKFNANFKLTQIEGQIPMQKAKKGKKGKPSSLGKVLIADATWAFGGYCLAGGAGALAGGIVGSLAALVSIDHGEKGYAVITPQISIGDDKTGIYHNEIIISILDENPAILDNKDFDFVLLSSIVKKEIIERGLLYPNDVD
ncbi:MAG: hypothetical protein LBN23_06780, partial [Paludibacter sp.]|nr:hypothetical protein [Paludibacter sp.]